MSDSLREADYSTEISSPDVSFDPVPGQAALEATPVTADDSAAGLLVRLRQRDKPLLASGEPAHGPG